MASNLNERKAHKICKIFLVLLLVQLPLYEAKADEAPWKPILEQQLHKDKGCEVNYYTNVREFDLANETVIEVKAHCIDGREFNAVRSKPHLPFEITICQPTYC